MAMGAEDPTLGTKTEARRGWGTQFWYNTSGQRPSQQNEQHVTAILPPPCASQTTTCQGSDAVLIRLEGVGQHAEAGNANLDAIPSLERTHAGGSSGQHQVAGFKGEDGADIGEQPGDGKDEVE